MKKIDRVQAENYLKSRKIHKHIRRAIALLAAFVMLFTMNTLKRTANTLSRYPMCHMDEHVHDASCYDEAGNLTCLIPEHVHSDACYQESPDYVPEEMEVDLGDIDDGDPGEGDVFYDQDDGSVDLGDAEEIKPYKLESPVMLSELVAAMGMNVDLSRVIEVGAVENDDAHTGLVAAEPQDGDWCISSLRAFDDAELALITTDDILIIPLTASAYEAPAAVEPEPVVETEPEPVVEPGPVDETEPEPIVDGSLDEGAPVDTDVAADVNDVTDENQTEVGHEETGDGTENQEQTEVSTDTIETEAPTGDENETAVDENNAIEEAGIEAAPVESVVEQPIEDVTEPVENVTEPVEENIDNNVVDQPIEGGEIEQPLDETEDNQQINEVDVELGGDEETQQADDDVIEQPIEGGEIDQPVEDGTEPVEENIDNNEVEQSIKGDEAEAGDVDETEPTEENKEEGLPAEDVTDQAEGDADEDAAAIEQGDDAEQGEDAEQGDEAEQGDDAEKADEESDEAEKGEDEEKSNEEGDEADKADKDEESDDAEKTDKDEESDEADKADKDEESDEAEKGEDEDKSDEEGDETDETESDEDADLEGEQDEDADQEGDEETEGDETEGDETEGDEAGTDGEAAEVAAPGVSVTVDLSSVDLMDAASVEADTVKLSVADLLTGADDAVEVDGDLVVDNETFAADATVTAAENVDVQDGVITLSAEALEAGVVVLEISTVTQPEAEPEAQSAPAEDAAPVEDVVPAEEGAPVEDAEPAAEPAPVVTTQTVEIQLAGYTGRTTDDIGDEGEQVTITPAKGNSLPADATANVEQVEAPEELKAPEEPQENILQDAVAYEITITNANNDEISETGKVEVKLNTPDLNVLEGLPEGTEADRVNFELIHIDDDGNATPVENAVFDHDPVTGEVYSVSFTTESFSTYVVRYTVDFTYVDEAGEEHFWQFPGTGSHALREVLGELGIEGETITEVTLTMTEVFDDYDEKDLYLTREEETGEWYINSDAAFDDTYELAVTVDHVIYRIEVTDDQEWALTVNFLGYDGNPLSGEALSALANNIYGIEADTDWGYKATGIQISAGSASATASIYNLPDYANGIRTIRIYDNDGKLTLSQWVNLDHNNINNNHIQEYEGFEVIPNSINLNPSTHTLSVDFQQAHIKQYNVRFAIQDPGLTITDADKYYVYVDMTLQNGSHVYGYNQIIVNPDQTIVDVPITEWYDSGKNRVSGVKIVEDASTQITIYTRPLKSDGTKDGYNDFGTLYEGNNRVTVTSGSSINRYNVNYASPTRGMETDPTTGTIKVYDTVTFTTPNGTISKGYIDNLLNDATDFGYYTGEFKGHAVDMEATIGAAKLSAVFSIDYGYSSNNVNVNRLKVLKIYTDADGNPVPDKRVGINLRKNGTIVGSDEKTTGADGKLEFEFTGLAPGEYTVSEVLYNESNQPVEIFESGAANVGDVNVIFSKTSAHFVNNSNMNYFGTIDYDNDTDLYNALDKGSRVPLVILTDTDESVQWVKRVADTLTKSVDVDVFKNGTNGYKKYDILNDLARFEVLSDDLWNATDSSTVRIINKNATEIKDGLQIEDDGRYVVVNVCMNDGMDFCPFVRLGTQELNPDYGQSGEENSSKVIFNLRSSDGSKPYGQGADVPPSFNTTKKGAGIILAPCANSHELREDFGGTIIAATVNHSTSELHSNNPNQIQKLNITIHNVVGTPKVGSLELRKEFVDASIKDKMTWFTFKVTVSNPADESKVRGQSFLASGLKSGDTVTFNQSGVAYVQVRPSNSVTIAGLPEGATYTVEEISTAGTSHYKCVGVVYPEQTQTHVIPAGDTAHVTVKNDVRRTGLTLKKTVQGTGAPSKTFTFDLYLWNEDDATPTPNKTAYTSTTGVTVTGTSAAFALAETASSDDYYPAGKWSGVTLTNGQEITIKGLPVGLHYALVERTGTMPANFGVVTEDGKATGVLDADGSLAEVVNKYYGPIDLGLQKKWKLTDGTEISAPVGASATFELKRIKTVGSTTTDDTGFSYTGDPNVTSNRVTLPVGGQWSYNFTNLPVYEVVGGVVTTYQYYLEEVSTTDGTVEYVDSNGAVISNPSTLATNVSGTQRINNKITPVSIEATKTWKSNSQTINDTIKKATVTFELQSRTRTGGTWSDWAKVTKNAKGEDITNPVTVSVETANAQAWKVTWTDLLKNENIQYQVIETYAKVGEDELVSEGSDKPTQSVSFVSGSNTGTANIDNTLPTTQISVKKTWNGSDTDWLDDHVQVEMTLKANNEPATSLPGSQNAVVKLTKDTRTHEWTNLPVYDNTGKKIAYTVEETGMWYQPDSGTAVKFVLGSEATLETYFTVTPTDSTDENGYAVVTYDNTPKLTEIQVTKVWTVNDVDRTDKESITFNVHRADENDLTVKAEQVEATPSGSQSNYQGGVKIYYVNGQWQTVKIKNLPKYKINVTDEAAAFTPIEYYVEEVRDTTGGNANSRITYKVGTGDENATASAVTTNDGTITIINRDTDLTLKILKVDATETTKKLSGAQFQLQKKSGENYVVYSKQSGFTDSPYADETAATLTINDQDVGITFQMVSDGEYLLVEKQAPKGYVMQQKVEIKFTVENGAIKDGIPTEGIVVDYVAADANGNPVVTVGNTPGSSLPATGGMGTTAVYVAGSALLLLALLGWVLSARKRRE